jgi:hypothetical protein
LPFDHHLRKIDEAPILPVIVLVQREMESRGFSIASIPPLRGGDFQGMGKSIEADAGGEDGG